MYVLQGGTRACTPPLALGTQGRKDTEGTEQLGPCQQRGPAMDFFRLTECLEKDSQNCYSLYFQQVCVCARVWRAGIDFNTSLQRDATERH